MSKWNQVKANAAMDAEQILAYFINRDKMNALIHFDNHERGLNIRYSPITFAAERVMESVWLDAFGKDGSTPPTIKSISE